MQIAPDTITATLNGREVEVEVYRPTGKPVAPGVLYLHEIYGVIDPYREDAQELANRGYLVYLPNLYSNDYKREYCVRAIVNTVGRHNSVDSPLYKEIAELIALQRQDPACNGELGMIGMCLTGGYVIQAAMRDGVEAPVIFHHSLGHQGAGIPRKEEAELLNVKRMQGHWSRVDPFCPRKRRDRLKQLLGDRLDDHIYNIPHGFRSLARKTQSSQLAWERTLAFFDEHLNP
ncbi:MAG: dienelactone hydrolase family protein [Gammaproteobacteria bacterium]|nr:dienelactone hydrolase family protein [Gammaproteobacteria bacterium]